MAELVLMCPSEEERRAARESVSAILDSASAGSLEMTPYLKRLLLQLQEILACSTVRAPESSAVSDREAATGGEARQSTRRVEQACGRIVSLAVGTAEADLLDAGEDVAHLLESGDRSDLSPACRDLLFALDDVITSAFVAVDRRNGNRARSDATQTGVRSRRGRHAGRV